MTPLDASAYVYPSNKYIKNYDAFSATINSFHSISNCENSRNHWLNPLIIENSSIIEINYWFLRDFQRFKEI